MLPSTPLPIQYSLFIHFNNNPCTFTASESVIK